MWSINVCRYFKNTQLKWKGTHDKVIILYTSSLQQQSYSTTSPTFQGVEYATYRTYFWMLLSGNVTDCICANCHKRNSRGNRLKKCSSVNFLFRNKLTLILSNMRHEKKKLQTNSTSSTYIRFDETIYCFVTINARSCSYHFKEDKPRFSNLNTCLIRGSIKNTKTFAIVTNHHIITRSGRYHTFIAWL